MVLAGLEQLHIRALFSQASSAVSLRRVALEVASEMGGGPPASNVELCMCPANYRGHSCQVRQWRWAPGPSVPPARPTRPQASTLGLHLTTLLLLCLLGITLLAASLPTSGRASCLFDHLLVHCQLLPAWPLCALAGLHSFSAQFVLYPQFTQTASTSPPPHLTCAFGPSGSGPLRADP